MGARLDVLGGEALREQILRGLARSLLVEEPSKPTYAFVMAPARLKNRKTMKSRKLAVVSATPSATIQWVVIPRRKFRYSLNMTDHYWVWKSC
ncbi:MAG: hypothetical protein ACXABL_15565 [Candidatus Thorarchaeota archaeon]|jgi:hypothetical protein